MKSFLQKIALFVILYLLVSAAIFQITPYHWGNPWYSAKIQFLEKQDALPYNTFFFGSSRIYRQTNPEAFDQSFKPHSDTPMRSFNLGAPAIFNPQCYYVYEQFLNSSLSQEAEYCFMELMNVNLLGDYFMHEERTTYWQNPKDLLFVGKAFYNNPTLSRKRKFKALKNYSISYAENLFHLGHFGHQWMKDNYYDENYVGFSQTGYFPLEHDLSVTRDSIVKKDLLQRNQAIKEHPEILAENRRRMLQANSPSNQGVYDKIHLQRINELIAKSNEKGIHLVFVLPPNSGGKALNNLGKRIPQAHFINPKTSLIEGI